MRKNFRLIVGGILMLIGFGYYISRQASTTSFPAKAETNKVEASVPVQNQKPVRATFQVQPVLGQPKD